MTASNDDPLATYEQYSPNLGQMVLRSEFESHFLAPDRLDAVLSRTPDAARIG